MSLILMRIVIFVLIGGAIFLGVRRIWRDWTRQFRRIDEEEHQRVRERDQRERARPDVITLERSDDGVFRPPGKDD